MANVWGKGEWVKKKDGKGWRDENKLQEYAISFVIECRPRKKCT